MTLSFPNPSRHFDERKKCISFKGHEGVFEINFDILHSGLQRLSSTVTLDEISMLSVFDAHRQRIEDAARDSHSQSIGRASIVII
jgi:hypothetical protein